MRLETRNLSFNPHRGYALALAVLSSLILPAAVHAADAAPPVSLAWNANPESDVAGYKVHFGTQSGVYTEVLDVGRVTQATLPQLFMGSTYYLAVSAYNSTGLESPRSAEFSLTAAVPPPPVGTSFAMASGGQGKLQWKYSKSDQASAERFAVYSSEDLVTWTEAARFATGAATSSDSQWLYYEYPYQVTKQKMFFKVAPRNAFGETE